MLSLEVGEHIASEHEDVFIGNIVRHAKEAVVLSWAITGQSGHYHINNHENSYIIAKMLEHRFSFDADTVKCGLYLS